MITRSDEASTDIQAAIDRALSEAISDGTLGNLETEQDSVHVEAPEGTWIFHLNLYRNLTLFWYYFITDQNANICDVP